MGEISCVSERWGVPAPHVASVVLYCFDIRKRQTESHICFVLSYRGALDKLLSTSYMYLYSLQSMQLKKSSSIYIHWNDFDVFYSLARQRDKMLDAVNKKQMYKEALIKQVSLILNILIYDIFFNLSHLFKA